MIDICNDDRFLIVPWRCRPETIDIRLQFINQHQPSILREIFISLFNEDRLNDQHSFHSKMKQRKIHRQRKKKTLTSSVDEWNWLSNPKVRMNYRSIGQRTKHNDIDKLRKKISSCFFYDEYRSIDQVEEQITRCLFVDSFRENVSPEILINCKTLSSRFPNLTLWIQYARFRWLLLTVNIDIS